MDSSGQKQTNYTFRYFRGQQMVSLANHLIVHDADAIALATDTRFGFDVEVWDDGRFVYGTDGHANRQKPA